MAKRNYAVIVSGLATWDEAMRLGEKIAAVAPKRITVDVEERDPIFTVPELPGSEEAGLVIPIGGQSELHS